MHISIIINPPSLDAIESLRAGVTRLRGQGHTVHPRVTFESEDAHRFAWKSAEYGVDLVVAAGGDGTINEVANGLLDWIEDHPGKPVPRLGLVPLGTANDLAGGLGIRGGDPQGALLAAAEGKPYDVDVGRVNGRYFLNVSTGGFGAEATDESSDELKRVLGPIAYLITGVRKFVQLRPSRARFSADGEVLHDGDFLVFAVGNAWRTGGGNWLTADADMRDRLLDVCVVEGMGHLDFVRTAPQIRAGRHVDNPHVTYRKVARLTVEADEEMTVNADGESLFARRFDYDIGEHRLTLSVPIRPIDGAAPGHDSAVAQRAADAG